MKRKKVIQIGGALLLTILPLVALTLPVNALSSKHAHTRDQKADTITVNVYLTTAALQQQFQKTINQSLTAQFNQSLTREMGQLPANSRALTSQLAGDLLQPSATVTRLTPQQGGLAATISLALFPGDPAPTNFSMLVTFNAQNASTIQVGTQALNGQPSPISGNLSAFHVSLGQVQNIATTPTCGDSALKMNMGMTSGQGQQAQQNPSPASNQGGFPIFIEVPASTISAIGSSTGPLQLGLGLTAQNVQISTQANGLVANSDIYLDSSQVGTATTYLQLSAANGMLIANATQTTVDVGTFSLSGGILDQLVAQEVTTRLNNLLGGVDVTNASFGPTNALPCVVNGDLLIAGTIAQL